MISPSQPSLFKSNTPRVGVLQLGDGHGRSHQFTYGLDAVCNELSVNVTRTLTPETVNDCDIALCSLCSVQDTLALVCALDERPKSRLIVGGHGVYPFVAWRHLVHRIAFGRQPRHRLGQGIRGGVHRPIHREPRPGGLADGQRNHRRDGGRLPGHCADPARIALLPAEAIAALAREEI